jgi:hypothetical protein
VVFFPDFVRSGLSPTVGSGFGLLKERTAGQRFISWFWSSSISKTGLPVSL